MSPKKLQKHFERLKTEAEEKLGEKIQDGSVKVGSEEYKRLCSEIEEADEMASRYNTAYCENN